MKNNTASKRLGSQWTTRNLLTRHFFAPCLMLVGLSLHACGGGGGSTGPMNPAPNPPNSTTKINMAGEWECTYSKMIENNKVSEFQGTQVDDRAKCASNKVLSFSNKDASRGAIEDLLGITFDWYTNQANERTVSFAFGWERVRNPLGTIRRFFQYGIRLAAIGPNTIAGFQACYWQGEGEFLRKAIYEIRFARVMDLNAGSGDSHQQESTPNVPAGANDTPRRKFPFKRPMSLGQVLRIPHTTKTDR